MTVPGETKMWTCGSMLGLGCALGAMLASAAAATANPAAISSTGAVLAEAPFERAAISGLRSIRAETAVVRIAQNALEGAGGMANVPNGASLSLQMSPEQSVDVGTKISFRVSAKKAGYVLLVDIDAEGRMSQIFPSPEMIARSPEAATNFIKPGQELLIPNAAAKTHGFEYVVTPPSGPATVVAILSDRRVQILDLPDNAQERGSASDIINRLSRWTNELRVPETGTGKLQPSNWSFDIKTYSIRPQGAAVE
jgi:Domain of unknown function (DUF4384)